MPETLSRLAGVAVERDTSLRLAWRDGRESYVDLAGWIGSGGDILEPLRDPRIFSQAAVSEHGAGVTWDDDVGDLAIDATHLEVLIAEQGRGTRLSAA